MYNTMGLLLYFIPQMLQSLYSTFTMKPYFVFMSILNDASLNALRYFSAMPIYGRPTIVCLQPLLHWPTTFKMADYVR